jgi:uncharacterized protein (DUF4415 family)
MRRPAQREISLPLLAARHFERVWEWRGPALGKFHRSIKEPVTIRVDADVLAWLKRQGSGYQTRINKLLREAMEGKRRA